MPGDLDRLREQLPDLFRDRPMPLGWEDEWMIIPIEQPGASGLLEDVEQESSADFGIVAPAEPRPRGGALSPSFGEPFAGSPIPPSNTPYPPPDALAFYLPFHYFHPKWWGVYIIAEGAQALRDIILKEADEAVLPDEAMLASRLFLYGHEAYHHAVEAFATRLEITHRKPLFRTGFEELYRSLLGSEHDLEEALATAAGLRKSLLPFKSQAKRKAIRRALVGYIRTLPLGYRLAIEYETLPRFRSQERAFAEANHAFGLDVPVLDAAVWASFPHAFTGISRITSGLYSRRVKRTMAHAIDRICADD